MSEQQANIERILAQPQLGPEHILAIWGPVNLMRHGCCPSCGREGYVHNRSNGFACLTCGFEITGDQRECATNIYVEYLNNNCMPLFREWQLHVDRANA